MDCVADRFVEAMNGDVIDLATGERVILRIASAGGESEQRQWMIRCDLFQKLHHPAIANLVDYGSIGETQRFEAWRCSAVWSGDDTAAQDATSAAASFLRACGLTIGPHGPGEVHHLGAQPLVVPAPPTGYTTGSPATIGGVLLPLPNCGVLSIERPATRAVAELLNDHSCRPDAVAIVGPPGSGKTTILRQLARAGRLQGYVPMSVRLLGTPFAEALEGRSALLFDDDGAGDSRGLLDVALRSPRRHILIATLREELRGAPNVALQRLPADALASAVVPAAMSNSPRVRDAAARASGIPGAFIHLLRGIRTQRTRRLRTSVSRVAEHTPAYGEEGRPDIIRGRGANSTPLAVWPAPGELTALRRQMEAAQAQLQAGRHAPGDRELRQAIGGLARRGVWTSAADGSLALADSLLKRGRVRDAIAVLDTARDYCCKPGNEDRLVSVATLSGVALVDLGRLDEAESVLGAAASAVATGDDISAAAKVKLALALARCRFWRGEYADADGALAHLGELALDDAAVVRVYALRARVAVGIGDLSKGIEMGVEAARRAAAAADPWLIASAACAAAFAHLAVGDLPAIERDAATGVPAARASRDPLRAFRLQLTLAEQLRRLGRRTDAIDAIRRVNRASAGSLPPILRRRREMLRDLLIAGLPLPAVIARHVAGSGLPALALFLPRERLSPYGTATPPGLLDDAVETLRLCQDAADERVTLTAVCGHVQRQVRATAVAFFGVERGVVVRLACNGVRIESAVAGRAVAASAPIAPHRIDEQIEAAAPVRYAGATIGAIAIRWTVGSSPDPARTVAAMTVAAVAVGPIMAGLLSARDRTEPARATGLLGISPAMIDVRRAVERAANAPFAILIEGESGSGKELVAREVHRGGPRRDRPFCTLNCAALPDELVESELFGHARGAFTGAVGERIGVFEEAHTGTLLLDEVGELSPRAQQRSCASFRKANCAASARTSRAASTSASSRRRTGTCGKKSRAGGFVSTCSIGSTSSGSSSLRCAIAGKTSRFWSTVCGERLRSAWGAGRF
jgi:hypothetical protein